MSSLHMLHCLGRSLDGGLGFSALVQMGLQTPCIWIRNGIALMVQGTASVVLHHWSPVLRPDAPS